MQQPLLCADPVTSPSQHGQTPRLLEARPHGLRGSGELGSAVESPQLNPQGNTRAIATSDREGEAAPPNTQAWLSVSLRSE